MSAIFMYFSMRYTISKKKDEGVHYFRDHWHAMEYPLSQERYQLRQRTDVNNVIFVYKIPLILRIHPW